MSNLSKALVFLQFSCLIFLVFFTSFMTQGLLLLVQICGLLLSLWAVFVMRPGHFNIQPEIKPNAHFVNIGPYRLIRNPMYTGLIIFFGSVIFKSFELIPCIVLIILILVLLLKIKLEERFLEKRFGEVYLIYKIKTYRLFPFIF